MDEESNLELTVAVSSASVAMVVEKRDASERVNLERGEGDVLRVGGYQG
jgi:hypothetical protein